MYYIVLKYICNHWKYECDRLFRPITLSPQVTSPHPKSCRPNIRVVSHYMGQLILKSFEVTWKLPHVTLL